MRERIFVELYDSLWLFILQYYDDYGDIIKATLGKAREINKVNSARTMALALTMIFRELHKDNVRINRQGVDFISLKVWILPLFPSILF